MKRLYFILLILPLINICCSKSEPPVDPKPPEAFNVTIDGDRIATGPTTSVLYKDYLLINTYGEFDLTYLIYLPDGLPTSMGTTYYSSLAMTSPEQALTNISGGTGSVISLTLDMVNRLASGTFTALLINPADGLDISDITEANFSSIKFQIAADTAQIYGELSQEMDGMLSKANAVFANDTTISTAGMTANVHGEYEVLIKNIPKTPGIYSFDAGNYAAATGISIQINVFDDAIFSNVLAGGTLEVVSYDPSTFTLVVNYTVSIQEPGGDQVDISNGYVKFYTGGVH